MDGEDVAQFIGGGDLGSQLQTRDLHCCCFAVLLVFLLLLFAVADLGKAVITAQYCHASERISYNRIHIRHAVIGTPTPNSLCN